MSALALRRRLLADNEVHPAMRLSKAIRIGQERDTLWALRRYQCG
jgi:hypothetical protein